jgi:hypothetical protein
VQTELADAVDMELDAVVDVVVVSAMEVVAVREHLLFCLAQASHAKPHHVPFCGWQRIWADLHPVQLGLLEPQSQ